MASIKGITIEINGDTSKLSKALSGVNEKIRATQTELKAVEKGLELDPGNVELVAKKQELLAQAIEETKEKLEIEREAAEQANEALANGDISETQYQNLQAEIQETTNNLTELQQEASGAELGSGAEEATEKFRTMKDAVKDVGETTQEVGDKVTEVGKGLSVVSAAVTAVGAASVAAYKTVDTGADTIRKKTGAVGADADEMIAIMNELATTIPTEFETAGTAVGEVNTRFGVTGDELKELSEQFIKFAELNDTDVNSSIDNVQKTMAAFGVGTSNTGALLDTLNKVGQDTGISMDTLTSLMLSNSSALQGLGMNASDAAIFLGQMEKSGVEASTVMTGLARVNKEAMENGTSMGEELKKAISDSNSAISIFGSKAGPKLMNAFKNGTLSVEMFSGGMTSLQDNLGSVDQTFQSTIDGTDEMKMAMNQLQSTGASLGTSILETLSPIIKDLANAIANVKQWWDNLSPGVQEAIVKAGMVVAVVGPIVAVVGKVISVIGSVITAITALNPVVLGIIAAITAVIGIGVALWKNWDKIKEAAAALGQWLGEKFAALKNKLSEIITAIKDFFSEKFTAIKNKVSEVFTNISTAVKEKVANIKNAIVEGVTNAINFLKELPSKALTWGKDVIDNFTGGIKDKIGQLKDTLKGAADKVKSFLGFSEPEEGPLSNFHTYAPDMMDLFAKGIRENIGTVTNALGTATNAIGGAFTGTSQQQQTTVTSSATTPVNIVVPLSIGGQKFAKAVANANIVNSYTINQ